MRDAKSMILALVVIITVIFLGGSFLRVVASFGGR